MAAALALSVCAPAQANTSARELHLIARAIGFVRGMPRGAVDVAVIDGEGADAVMAAMRPGVTAGGVTLFARRVSLDELEQSRVRVIVVPEGQREAHARIASIARRMHAVTASTDLACVQADYCVVGVSAQHSNQIRVSREAAEASDVSFSVAFRVLVSEN